MKKRNTSEAAFRRKDLYMVHQANQPIRDPQDYPSLERCSVVYKSEGAKKNTDKKSAMYIHQIARTNTNLQDTQELTTQCCHPFGKSFVFSIKKQF